MIKISVPCSTSNLGAGFDALGIALGGPALRLTARPGGQGLRIAALSGEGAGSLPRDESNRVIQAALLAAGGRALGAELEIDNQIPLSRGLGSSAAAALAGALLADALLDGALGERTILEIAVGMEGHPDNVVPCLRGGAQVAIRAQSGQVLSCPIVPGAPLAAALAAVLFLPDQPLATKEARAVLPAQVPLADAVFNLGRAALFAAALAQGRFELLGEAMADRLHQPARTALMPWLTEMIAAARDAGAYGAALSGAGTTVCALCSKEAAPSVAKGFEARAAQLGLAGRALAVDAAVEGAKVVVS